MKNETKGMVSLVAATAIYSFFGVLTRIVGFTIPVFYSMWMRNGVTILILVGIAVLTHQWRKIIAKDWKWFIGRSAGGMLGFLGSYFAFYYIPIGTAYFIFYGGSTVGGYLLGKMLFGERITKIKGVSLVIALLGLLLIYATRIGSGSVLWMSLAFAGGIGTAIWNVFSKKISGTYSDIQLNGTDFILSAMFAFIVSLLLREQWVPVSLNTTWIANAFFIVLFTSTGQLMVYGFKRLDAQIWSLIMLTEVLFGIIIGYLFYKELPTVTSLAGGLLILTAIILPELRWKRIQS